MSDNEKSLPYVYQPFLVWNKSHWDTKRTYGVGGAGDATIHGVSKNVAEKIVQILIEEINSESNKDVV